MEKGKDALCMILEFRNTWQSHLLKIQVWSWKIFEQSKFDVPVSRNIWSRVKSSSGSYRYSTHTWTKAMMEKKKTEYKVQIACYRNMKQMAVWIWPAGKIWTFGIMSKNQRTVYVRNWECDEALQEAFTKVHYREIFDELEVERISTRKIYKCKRQE